MTSEVVAGARDAGDARPVHDTSGTAATAAATFDADTAVERAGDGTWRGELSDRWDRPDGRPLGGYTLAVALAALGREVGVPAPLAASAHFLRPALHGPVTVETGVVRTGRRYATAGATLTQGGKPVLHVTGTYRCVPVEGRTLVLADPPRLPDPDRCFDAYEGFELGAATITQRVECRYPAVPGWRAGVPTGLPAAELWLRLAGEEQHAAVHLPLLVDAAAPVVFELGELGSSTLELTVHLRGDPAPGWLAARAVTRFLLDGHHEEDLELWDSAGRLVAQSRQLAVLA